MHAAIEAAIVAAANKQRDLILANRDTIAQHIRDSYSEWAAEHPETDKEFAYSFGLSAKIIPRGEEAEVAVTLKHAVKYSTSDSTTARASDVSDDAPELARQRADDERDMADSPA
jgi:hypothetical protein